MPAMPRPLLATLLIPFIGTAAAAPHECPQCETWNQTQPPFKIFGNSYYVGPRGLSSILITSDRGHVLIDGGLHESAPKIAESVRALGFRVEDIKVILNTHVHYDHAGGIAALQKMSGARVWASPSSAKVLESGESGPDDPQFGILPPIEKTARVSVLKDDGVVRVGPIEVTAKFTPGHTPGGTSWSWKSCEGERCLNLVYADSTAAISAPEFKFSSSGALKYFEKSYATLESIPCDILVTPHPELSNLWQRLEARETQGKRDALIDTSACDMYVETSRERLRKRLAQERGE
jgi:metallo-beta-lactamase class B